VEDSSKIRFWHDQWCEDVALKEAFLDLFGITYANDAFVPAHLEFFWWFQSVERKLC